MKINKPTETDSLIEKKIEALRQHYKNVLPDINTTREALTSLALAFRGMKEIGSSNTGYWIDLFFKQLGIPTGNPWCVAFVQYVFLEVSGWFGKPDLLPKNTASTQLLANWADNNSILSADTGRTQPGDLIIFRDGSDFLGHIAMIVFKKSDEWDTISGNTNDKESREGNVVGLGTTPFGKYGKVGEPKVTSRWIRGFVHIDDLYRMFW